MSELRNNDEVVAVDVLAQLKDLHHQATHERSHFYVGGVVRSAICEILNLRSDLRIALAAQSHEATPTPQASTVCMDLLKKATSYAHSISAASIVMTNAPLTKNEEARLREAYLAGARQ